MAAVGQFTVGISPLGHGPDHPASRSYSSTGAYTLAAGEGTADSGGNDLSAPARSGTVEQLLYATWIGAPGNVLGAPIYLSYPISGGSIVEDLESVPYASGTIEVAPIDQLNYLNLEQGPNGANFVGVALNITVTTRLGTDAAYHEKTVSLGRFYAEEVRRRADPGRFSASFVVTSEATGTLGPAVAGDLTGLAMETAGRLGLMADGRASIEGIICWLLERGGRRVRLAEGFLGAQPPTPAFQLLVDGNYVGPYSMGTRGSAQVLKRALLESGTYIASDPDGTAVLTPWPHGLGAPIQSVPVRSYGYGTDDHPFVFVGPAPIAKPSAVSVVQQSALFSTRTVTVAIDTGQGTGVVRYMNHYRPVAGDPDDHQTLRANQFAAYFVMSAASVEIGVVADGAVHAGDAIRIDVSSHGITPGIFLVTRATHPLGPDNFSGSLVCQRLAHTWTP